MERTVKKPYLRTPGSINPFDVDHLVFIGGNWLVSLGWYYEQGVGWHEPDGRLFGGPGDHGQALTRALEGDALERTLRSLEPTND